MKQAVDASVLGREAVRALAEPGSEPCVSVFLPLPARRGFDDPKHLQGLLQGACRDAQRRLAEAGVAKRSAQPLLDALNGLCAELELGHHLCRGAALFCSPVRQAGFRLLHEPEGFVGVAAGFRIRPLLRELQVNVRYRLLTVSDHAVRLREGDGWGLRELPQGSVPSDLVTALGPERSRNQQGKQIHSGGQAGQAVVHAQGNPNEARETDRHRFHRRVARALEKRWVGSRSPLVLVADASHQGEFRQICRLDGLLEEGVEGNPDRLGVDRLHELAWPVVEEWRAEREREELARAEAAQAHPASLTELTDTFRALERSGIRLAWIDPDACMPGRFDLGTGELQETDGDDDVLEQLSAAIVTQGGTVHVTQPGSLSSSSPWVAISRDTP